MTSVFGAITRSSLKEFYNRVGLDESPFNTYTTENEKDKITELFIHPAEYAPIVESFNHGRTMLLTGNRGTGKTALLLDLLRSVTEESSFICSIDNYQKLGRVPDLLQYYKLIIRSVTSALFSRLAENKKIIDKSKIGKEDRLLLSYLLKYYTDPITKKELKEKIEQVQSSKFKRTVIKGYNYIRYTLNYGATVASNMLSDTITSHFSKLPPIVERGKVKEFFPEISTEADEDFISTDATYAFIERVISLIEQLGYKRIILTFDKLDEDPRFENDADGISEFIKPLVTDNNLLTEGKIQLIISLWVVPFNLIKDAVRTQKHYCPEIEWTKYDLIAALNQRLKVYSSNKVTNFASILELSVTDDLLEELISLSNSNPRDLWHIMNRVITSQYELDPESDKISSNALQNGFGSFVTKFNFFEYYPRKLNSRANSMDVYSYIAHLQKLNTESFTRNQLNERAGTGSSTNGYVYNMEKMGLVKNIGQVSGNVVYRIADPKVVYAMKNGIKIERP